MTVALERFSPTNKTDLSYGLRIRGLYRFNMGARRVAERFLVRGKYDAIVILNAFCP